MVKGFAVRIVLVVKVLPIVLFANLGIISIMMDQRIRQFVRNAWEHVQDVLIIIFLTSPPRNVPNAMKHV